MSMNKDTTKKISFYYSENSLNSFFINNKQIYLINNVHYTEKIKEKVPKIEGKAKKKRISKISILFYNFLVLDANFDYRIDFLNFSFKL